MSTAGLFSIFLIGIASNLDNAGVGIAYGIRKIRISWFNNFIIAFFGFSLGGIADELRHRHGDLVDQLHAADRGREPDAGERGRQHQRHRQQPRQRHHRQRRQQCPHRRRRERHVRVRSQFRKDVVTDFHIADTIQFDHTVFASVNAILAALGTDGQGNATITANANEAVTVDNVSATVLGKNSDAFHLK